MSLGTGSLVCDVLKLAVDVSILDLTRHGGDMQCGYICSICN